MVLETLVNVLLAFEPRAVIAVMQTTMMRANMTAYSTAVGPSSRARKSTTKFLRLVMTSSFREQKFENKGWIRFCGKSNRWGDVVGSPPTARAAEADEFLLAGRGVQSNVAEHFVRVAAESRDRADANDDDQGQHNGVF